MERKKQEQAVTQIIKLMGVSLKNRGLYPSSHPLVRTPVEQCLALIHPFFDHENELALAISDGTLVLEGVPIFTLTSSLEFLMTRLGRIGVPALIFMRGLDLPDIDQFIRFLHETKAEGMLADEIRDRLLALGIRHIRVMQAEPEADDDHAVAKTIYANAIAVVASVLGEIRSGRIPSGAETVKVVSDMGSMLTRNRDALLALTLIKNFDEYTFNHSVNVSVLALTLADQMEIGDEAMVEVGVAGLLHDIGKTQLALDLIRKPGTLTADEFEEIKKHPDEGFLLTGKMSDIPTTATYMVREHHMHYDRSGYPRTGPGYRLYQHSAIISVADCYDALTTMRCYQAPRTPSGALQLMEGEAGKAHHPGVVAQLRKAMGDFPVGTMVRLNTMEVGVVTGTAEGLRAPSRVAILFERDGKPMLRPEEVDIDLGYGGPGAGRMVMLAVNPMLFPYAAASTYLNAAAS
ncbi:MAG TPA: HD domain-containing phosphohydrolase [Candidatus Deferrimicrobiaceae bacterium]|jgi:putative nucleotidyltransferase with HDIG domain